MQNSVESMSETNGGIGIPATSFARIRWDALALPVRGEYMIIHNLYTCWEGQASPDSIRGDCTILTVVDDLLLDSTEGGWVSLCCRVVHMWRCSLACCCRAWWNSQVGFAWGSEETL